MRQRRILVLLMILIVVITALCIVPFRITRSVTLQAVKLDATGKELGTVEIPVKYTVSRTLLSRNLRKVVISDFDGYPGHEINFSKKDKNPFADYWETTVGSVDVDFDMPTPENPNFVDSMEISSYRYIVKVSGDLQQWYIGVGAHHYVVSIPADHTPAELLDYFDISIPGSN